MNILVSSTILALSLILLADSIYRLRPHNTKHKKSHKSQPANKSQPMTRAKESVIDLRMTDLREN